jgi:hypothetical protein
MNRLPKLPAILVLAGAVSGCASGLSQQECQVADWYTIGFEDGTRGLPESQVSVHRKACAEHGIALDLTDYRNGRQAGIEAYCQPGNAYNLGRNGKVYRGVCPAAIEQAFLDAYSDGKSLYALEREVQHLHKVLKRKHHRLEHIEVEMRDAGLELVAPGVPTERRVVLLDSLRKLGDERSEIKAQIPDIEAELADKRHQLDSFTSARAY